VVFAHRIMRPMLACLARYRKAASRVKINHHLQQPLPRLKIKPCDVPRCANAQRSFKYLLSDQCQPLDKFVENLPQNVAITQSIFNRALFHKILKSGCKAEESKLRSAERLVNLIATLCILGWRIFWMTMINRSAEDASPKLALTPLEIDLLDRLVK